MWDSDTQINLKGMKTTIAIYNDVNPSRPAAAPEKYIDQSYLSEALRELGGK